MISRHDGRGLVLGKQEPAVIRHVSKVNQLKHTQTSYEETEALSRPTYFVE